MDDYTWKRKVTARRRRVRYERIFVLLLLIVGISYAIWDFTSRTKTPTYAINKIIESITIGDLDTFNKYVDLTPITTRAYDDLTGDMFKNDEQISMNDRILFENFYVLIRPQMCQGAMKVINTKIRTGTWTLPEEILKGRQLGIDFELLLERSLIRNTAITGVENVEHHGGIATADIKIIEENSQTPFTLKVTLENGSNAGLQMAGSDFEIFGETWKFPGLSFSLEENSWRLISVDNYKEYLETVTPILQKDINAYIDATAEIVNYYNDVFYDEQTNFITMQRTSSGVMSDSQRNNIYNYIYNTIIPTLENRQAELNQIEVPNGAKYLASLRAESTATTIQAWKYYAQGISENDAVAFETAETVHKQELIIDQRIEEIIKNSAVARNLPNLP